VCVCVCMLEGTYVVYFYDVSISLYNGFINVCVYVCKKVHTLSISTMFLLACIMVSSMCVCVCMLEGTHFVYFYDVYISLYTGFINVCVCVYVC
jgi:hypothetical protein